MIRLTLLFSFILSSINLFAQKYLTTDVIATGDSILKEYVSDSIFKYCSFDLKTRYQYEDVWGHSFFELFNTNKTRGKFKSVELIWNVKIPYPKCPAMDTIKGQVFIYLDSLLQPTTKRPLNFIPDFYITKDSCHLIKKEAALAIAKKLELEKGVDSLQAVIKYDEKSKIFTWEVSQTIKRAKDVFDSSTTEVVIIDALSSEVIKHLFIHHEIQF